VCFSECIWASFSSGLLTASFSFPSYSAMLVRRATILFCSKFLRLRDSWTNPYELSIFEKKFQNESTNQIFKFWDRKSGFVRIQDLRIWIFKDSFCTIVLKIHEKNWMDSWSTTGNESSQVRIYDPQYKPDPDSWSRSQDESMDSLIRFPQLKNFSLIQHFLLLWHLILTML
jgi:hypothetical protein